MPRFTPWLLVLTLTAAGAAAALGYGLTAPKRYRATAQLLATPVSAADSTFAGYFVSPYAEPAVLLGILGTLLAHVPGPDPGGPVPEFARFLGQLGAPLQHHEVEGRPIVVHAESDSPVTGKIAPFYRFLRRVEHHIVPVQQEPDRRHMGAPIGANGRQLAGTCAVRDERPPLLVGHVLCHAPILLARAGEVVKAGGRSSGQGETRHGEAGTWRRTRN